MTLDQLPLRAIAYVDEVEDAGANDLIARRLREYGFVRGEQVQIVAAGPFRSEPLLVQIGFTRFALRRREAARVLLLAASASEVVE